MLNVKTIVGTGTLALLLGAGAANAGVTLTAQEVDGNVVLSGGGDYDLSMWNYFGSLTRPVGSAIGDDLLIISSSAAIDLYEETGATGLTLPNEFALPFDLNIDATSSSGDIFGMQGPASWLLIVPQGYTSGDQLEGSATWENHTFDSLGLIQSEYTWTWNTATGGTDFFTVQVVPAPGTLGALGLVGLMSARRRRAH